MCEKITDLGRSRVIHELVEKLGDLAYDVEKVWLDLAGDPGKPKINELTYRDLELLVGAIYSHQYVLDHIKNELHNRLNRQGLVMVWGEKSLPRIVPKSEKQGPGEN